MIKDFGIYFLQCLLIELVFFYLVKQRAVANLQKFGCFSSVPVGPVQNLGDQIFLLLGNGLRDPFFQREVFFQ